MLQYDPSTHRLSSTSHALALGGMAMCRRRPPVRLAVLATLLWCCARYVDGVQNGTAVPSAPTSFIPDCNALNVADPAFSPRPTANRFPPRTLGTRFASVSATLSWLPFARIRRTVLAATALYYVDAVPGSGQAQGVYSLALPVLAPLDVPFNPRSSADYDNHCSTGEPNRLTWFVPDTCWREDLYLVSRGAA